jgi:predicted N-acetyltransferase YhbS
MIHLADEQFSHETEIDALVVASFGPARFSKTVYKFRDQIAPVAELGLVMIDDVTNKVVATLRFWPVLLPNGKKSVLLGPLAVDETLRGCGLGRKLMWNGITRARARGYQNIILVGDPEYYHQFGFNHDVVRGLSLPGWVDLRRFLGLEFKSGSLLSQRGSLRPVTQATESEQAAVEEDRPVAFKDDPIFLRSFA